MSKLPDMDKSDIKRRTVSDASHLIKNYEQKQTSHPIGEVEVKSRDQTHISLGVFSNIKPPKGFTTYVTPNPQDDAIDTQIVRLDAEDDTYELVLYIGNYGDKTISAEIRQF